jgi:hypothetical protein
VGDKQYLVNASWWRKWCDYVNFSLDCDDSHSDSPSIFYDKPGAINNNLLMHNQKLKYNLSQNFDYQIVNFEVWQCLSQWYSFDIKICRRLIKDNIGVRLDLYPDDHRYMEVHSTLTTKSLKSFSSDSDFNY